MNVRTPIVGGGGVGGAFFNAEGGEGLREGAKTMMLLCPIQSKGKTIGFIRIVKLASRKMIFEGSDGDIGWVECGDFVASDDNRER
jgi:hypothetical protein